MHDWGSVGLAFAQRFPERIERLVLTSCVPFVPGYRWHRVARGWRTPLLGELLMGFTTAPGFRRTLPAEIADRAYDEFDHGTQRAVLRALPRLAARGAGARTASGSASCAARR